LFNKVPPKDERWLVHTVNKRIPQDAEADRSFWDKLVHKVHGPKSNEEEEEEGVSISVPADAALKHLGVQGDDSDLLAKKNYFQKMAARVKEKFDEDDNEEDSDSESDGTEQEKLERRQRKRLAPKVDPKEMKEAHRALYNQDHVIDVKADEEADKKKFGSWWGCHPRRSRAERKLAEQKEAEAEQARVLAELQAKQQAERDAAAAAEAAAKAAKRKWWQFKAPETAEQKLKEKEKKQHKSSMRKHQAIAAAGKKGTECLTNVY
jgi:hypothetical protein